MKRKIIDFLVINLGVFLMAFGYSVFIEPYNLTVGGVGGIAIIIKYFIPNIPSSVFIFALNMILLILALIFISKEFFVKTLLVSIIYPLYVYISELIYKYLIKDYFINLESLNELAGGNSALADILKIGPYLLLIVVSSVFVSVGLGLALKKGSSTGGVDIIQKILLKYCKLPYSVSLIMIDGSIVITSAIIFKNYLMVIYGVSFIIISGVVVDSIVFNGFNSRAVHIITDKPDEIKKQIIEQFNRTVTILKGTGGYSGNQKEVLICIMINREFYRLRDLVNKIDPTAFIYVMKASEVHGEGFTYLPEDISRIKE